MIGYKPVEDPKADELRNSNLSRAKEEDSNIPNNQEDVKPMKGEKK